MKNILERDRSGEPVSCDDPEYYKIKAKSRLKALNSIALLKKQELNLMTFCWK